MNNSLNKITAFFKSNGIKYVINDDESKITLAYVYGKKSDLARVILFIQRDNDSEEVEMGFVDEISNEVKLEDALEKLLILNNRLKTGKIGLADESKKTLIFSIHFPLEEKITQEFYQQKIETCFGIHSLLIEEKIIENNYSKE